MTGSQDKPIEFHAPEFEGCRIVSSSELFSGHREVLIRHGKDCYRLLITRAGKLILNK